MIDQEFWTDKRGARVHKDIVPHDEKLKTELVYNLTDKALRGVKLLRAFKGSVVDSIDEFMDMMRQKYNIEVLKGTKGNVTLQSFDGLRKVQIAVATHIDFDEKLTLAKEKIDEYLKAKTQDADPEIRTLIMKVFEVDKKGNVNAKQILSLKGYKISHPKWLEAMEIIDDAIEIVGSKSYIRFYKRDSIDEPFEAISLDFAGM